VSHDGACLRQAKSKDGKLKSFQRIAKHLSKALLVCVSRPSRGKGSELKVKRICQGKPSSPEVESPEMESWKGRRS